MSNAVIDPRQVSAANGWQWIVQGFGLFRQSPVIWIALFMIYLLIGMLMSQVKLIGPILLNLLAPVFVAGFMLGCRTLDRDGELEINHLFAGFRHNTAQLISVGGMYLAGIIIIVGIMFAGADNTVVQSMMSGQKLDPQQAERLGSTFLLPALAGLFLLLPLIMAYWFAPVLVVFHGLSAPSAMKLSLQACLRNLLPFLVYSAVSMVLLLVAAIPLGLGLLVMIPTMTASLYVSYRDIFGNTVQADVAQDDEDND